MPTYCDSRGNPDPSGDFMLVNDKVLLREGRRIGFDLALLDSKPAPTSVFLRDGQLQAAAGDQSVLVARARQQHDLKHGHLGAKAPEFTDAMATAASRAAVPAPTPSIADRAAADPLQSMRDQAAALRRARYLP